VLDPGRGHQRVGVAPGDDVADGDVESVRGGGRDAWPVLAHHTGAEAVGDGDAVVRAPVVDHDDLVGLSGLLSQCGEAVFEQTGVVEYRDDH
jgi:hypothetical protein